MRILFVLLFCLLLSPGKAQERFNGIPIDTTQVSVVKFDKNDLEQFRSDSDFDYTETVLELKPSWIERAVAWIYRNLQRIFEWIFGVESATGIFSLFWQALPYLIGVTILYLLVRFFMSRNSDGFMSRAKNHTIIAASEEEELIKNANLEELLENAIAAKAYRLAIRYYYLLLLKSLDEHHLIIWEPQKTNEDYLRELQNLKLKSSFEENTRLYDFVWYGDFDLDSDAFESAKKEFDTTNKLIKTEKS